MSSLLLRQVRIVPVGAAPAPRGPVDVRVAGDRVVAVGPRLRPGADEQVLAGEGRWLIPGLWDAHVHLGQWAQAGARLDLSGVGGVEEALAVLAGHLTALPPPAAGDAGVVQGWGHRSATWARRPTVGDLDAVAGARPVVLISGDAHHAWANTAALDLLGLPRRDGMVEEREWFEAFPRLAALPGAERTGRAGLAEAVRRAAAAGVVGIGEMEFAANHTVWPQRVADGLDALRVRAAVYPDRLAEVLAAGLRTGDVLDDAGLVTMGPLKIISDGSLNTRTAWCHHPYADATGPDRHGVRNYPPPELAELLARAVAGGLRVAVHAIGDAAVGDALDVVERTGAAGSIEHAQLVAAPDVARMARLGLVASVQPAHLLDDREVTARCWPRESARCFPLRSLAGAGVRLALGSDAPVSPLDPWLAMAAAVWRGGPDEEAWHPEQSLTAAQALAASTGGRGTVGPGSVADLALLDADPLAGDPPSDDSPHAGPRAAAAGLRSMRVAATVCAGRITHLRR